MDTISVKNNCTLCDSLRSLWTGSSSSSLPSSSMSMSSFWPEILISDFNSKMSSCFYHYLLYPIKAGCLCLSEWQSCELDVKTMCDLRKGFDNVWFEEGFQLILWIFGETSHLWLPAPSLQLGQIIFLKTVQDCHRMKCQNNAMHVSLSLSGFDKRASES